MTAQPFLSPRPHLAVGIASTGRCEVIASLLPRMVRQTRTPDEVVVCVADEGDIDRRALGRHDLPIRVLLSERGSCCQRNHILHNVPEADVLVFLDDDFLMGRGYLAEIESVFTARADVALCTGTVDVDGITGPGLAVEEAVTALGMCDRRAAAESSRLVPVFNGYGCNMAVRMATVRQAGLLFDENLPLYGWLEDVDFSRRLAAYGTLVRSARARGVHLGTKIGRTSGRRFGYSQIANPLYLAGKGTISRRHAADQLMRNLAANCAMTFRPEPWIDRKGRLKGNLQALADLALGRLAPQNILLMDNAEGPATGRAAGEAGRSYAPRGEAAKLNPASPGMGGSRR